MKSVPMMAMGNLFAIGDRRKNLEGQGVQTLHQPAPRLTVEFGGKIIHKDYRRDLRPLLEEGELRQAIRKPQEPQLTAG